MFGQIFLYMHHKIYYIDHEQNIMAFFLRAFHTIKKLQKSIPLYIMKKNYRSYSFFGLREI
jgi:hypothetical protein